MGHIAQNQLMTGLRSFPRGSLATFLGFVLAVAASPTHGAMDIWAQMDQIVDQLVKPANAISNEVGPLLQSDPAKACEMAKTSTAMMRQAQVRADAINPVQPGEMQAVQQMRDRFKEILPAWDSAEKMVCSRVPAS
jgi:hypothetical protein